MASLILFNKPFGVLSQFTTKEDKPTLAQYVRIPRVYPAGRLDHDSEGLLLLTDDGDLQHHISHPAHKQPKTYWVQVEGAPNSYALTQLRQGVALNDGITQPAEVRLIAAPKVWERNPPIRSRQNIPTQWMEVTITEGKNRQVRRMTAAVGHPTLRLIRVKIGPWSLEGIEPGTFRVEQVNAPKAPQGARRGPNARPARSPESATPRARTTPNTSGNSNTSNGNRTDTDSKNSRRNSVGGTENRPDTRRTQFGARSANSTARGTNPGARPSREGSPATRTTPSSNRQPSASKPSPTKTVVIQKPRSKLSITKKETDE